MIRKCLMFLLIIPLLFSCKKEPIPNYEITVENCENPFSVTFKNLSENTTDVEWYIDGEFYMGDVVHLSMNNDQVHTVKLVANNKRKNASVEDVFNIDDYYILPTPSFSHVFPDCEDYKSVLFLNKTEGITEHYYWDFGDGSTSTSASPSHAYMDDGVYNVKLCAVRCNDSIWFSKNITINVHAVVPTAIIKASSIKNQVNSTTFLTGTNIKFESNSVNNSTQLWRLWNGSTENGTSFTRKLNTPGTYVVELVAICGEKRDSITHTIKVRDPEVMTVTSIELESFDDENDDNESWDEDGGKPDIYLKLRKGAFTLETTSTSNSVSSSSTPSWSMNEDLTDLDDDYTIEIWDNDSGSDDFMYSLSFEPEDYFSFGNYPSDIDVSSGGWRVELDVEWE